MCPDSIVGSCVTECKLYKTINIWHAIFYNTETWFFVIIVCTGAVQLIATAFRNVKQNDYTSANTHQKTKVKQSFGIIISFSMEVTFCVFKSYFNVNTDIYIKASYISAHCKYCIIFVQWVDYTLVIYYWVAVHLHNS